ncbi:unnamed protein product [Lepeophtheirus salmonis]|uniref:(salmon louse) hypothetical protein n=1 Tax=Lepeophtheirus salmonis TaxID=72036 RepID=A0A7R8CQA5_LEPSM|nr:unnamed protein product [Lepeophtheirus salmonis]CAF2857880.1 unnamed protein product [Lepeophtheirus salmonis]
MQGSAKKGSRNEGRDVDSFLALGSTARRNRCINPESLKPPDEPATKLSFSITLDVFVYINVSTTYNELNEAVDILADLKKPLFKLKRSIFLAFPELQFSQVKKNSWYLTPLSVKIL